MLSIFLHVGIWALMEWQMENQGVSVQDVPLEIVMNDPRKDSKMMVDSKNQAEIKKDRREVRFRSDQTRRTNLETVQRPTRPSNMTASIGSNGQKGRRSKKKVQNRQQSKSNNGDYAATDERQPLYLPGFGGTDSQPLIPQFVQQQLPPGVRLGNITALNTDQHRYYSFNRRLLSRFVPLWGKQVRSALLKWLAENNNPAVGKTWVTNVEVIMDKNGEILQVQPFRLSGLWSIDEASINSFQAVKQVPNPPEEMIDENGYIHLEFQTEVYYIPQPGVRFHGGGPSN